MNSKILFSALASCLITNTAMSETNYSGKLQVKQFRGNYSPQVIYNKGQTVTFGNQTWIALIDKINRTTESLPSNASKDWALFSSSSGIPGPQGPEGPQGPIGPQGLPGVMGLQGPKGDTGAQGIAGPVGPKGDSGVAGPQGATGPQGPKGDAGAQGIAGPAGQKGDTGEIGPPGPKGDQGPSGFSLAVYKPTVQWTSPGKPTWILPALASGHWIVTLTATTNWELAGGTNGSNLASCTAIGLKGSNLTDKVWVRRTVPVSWNYYSYHAAAPSIPNYGSASTMFTGYVDAVDGAVQVQLACTLNANGLEPTSAEAELTAIAVDSVQLLP